MDELQEKGLYETIADIAAEEWRFRNVFFRAIISLPTSEQKKYRSRYTWFSKKVGAAVEQAGLRVVSLEGQLFDIGMAARPLNIDDFEPDASLYVEQMVEPIIMKGDSILRTGVVILERAER